MRKVRHPSHVLEMSELVVGERYAFVHACQSGNHFVFHYAMGGVVADSAAAARRLGHDLNHGFLLGSKDEPQVEMLIAAPATGPVVTVHMDGWHAGCSVLASSPVLVYWRQKYGCRTGWDLLTTYFGPPEKEYDDHHCLVVPVREWDADPRLHVATWSNPDGVVERASSAESAAGWERRMRARAHAAMARMLGFH